LRTIVDSKIGLRPVSLSYLDDWGVLVLASRVDVCGLESAAADRAKNNLDVRARE
jgi:hypothetical protein